MFDEEKELLCWLRLARSKNIGAVTFWQIIKRYGSAISAVSDFSNIKKLSKRTLELASVATMEQELQEHEKIAAKLICAYQPEYPKLLSEINSPPPVLSVRGNLSSLHEKCVSIVGARNCSIHGKAWARQIAKDLAESGWTVVSGLARGIDGAAHLGAVNNGTVAVVAGGVDIIYPPEHAVLYHELQQQGAVVSEMPLGMHPGATHFPRRNRIISGLSQGVVVVEAARRSGSLITARYAAEQGRDVLAVPGSPHDPRCQGANDLLKQGAMLVESAEDIITNLASATTRTNHLNLQISSKVEEEEIVFDSDDEYESMTHKEQILIMLSTIPVPIDDLIRELDLASSYVLHLLSELEISGQIIRHPNNNVTIGLHREIA